MGIRFARRRRRRAHQTDEEVRGSAPPAAAAGGAAAGLPLYLQRTLKSPATAATGNSSERLQTKLTVNQPGDPHEVEAERTADLVLHAPAIDLTPAANPDSRTPALSQIAPSAGAGSASTDESTPDVSGDAIDTGTGQALPERTRRLFEMRLGADLSPVRIHQDPRAAALSRTLSADAFTVGHDVYFASGKYHPETHQGLRLLAHELTHVVQQDPALVQPSPAPDPARPGGLQNRPSTPGIQRQLGLGIGLDPLSTVFEGVVLSNIALASAISIPELYMTKLIEYAGDHPEDGAILLGGFIRFPTYYSGGWILDVQTNAKAMTLDRAVFVDGNLDIGTYIHEMVHVLQYGILGRTAFLVSYFGLSAATIAWRFINQEPLDVMQSSPHENQAYELAARFMAWYRLNP